MCYRLQLAVGSTYAAGAAVLMATLADQISLPWPDEFPRKISGKKLTFDVMACGNPGSLKLNGRSF